MSIELDSLPASTGSADVPPLYWSVQGNVMALTRRALESGLENTKELLVQHEAALGRTTRKNRVMAEMYERDINEMQSALSQLPND